MLAWLFYLQLYLFLTNITCVVLNFRDRWATVMVSCRHIFGLNCAKIQITVIVLPSSERGHGSPLSLAIPPCVGEMDERKLKSKQAHHTMH